MAILVSGGAGYIGSHTCIELLNAGYDVVVADNYYNASPVVLDRIKQITGKDFRFYKADMTKHEDVEHIFSECPDITAATLGNAFLFAASPVSQRQSPPRFAVSPREAAVPQPEAVAVYAQHRHAAYRKRQNKR